MKKIALLALLAAALAAGFFIYTHSDPVVEMRDGFVTIRTWRTQRLPVNDITGMTLETVLPPAGGQDSRYVQNTKPPFLRLQTRTNAVYINYPEPARTRALYERLTQELNK